jgi:hypothetical protein
MCHIKPSKQSPAVAELLLVKQIHNVASSFDFVSNEIANAEKFPADDF